MVRWFQYFPKIETHATGPSKAWSVIVLSWSIAYLPLTLVGCSTGSTFPSLFAFWLPGKFTQCGGWGGWGGPWQKVRRRKEGERWGISFSLLPLVSSGESRSFHGSSSYQMTPLSVVVVPTGQAFSLFFLPLALEWKWLPPLLLSGLSYHPCVAS